MARAALGEDTWLTQVVTAKPDFSPGWCYQPGLKKHTDRVFLSSACETLDQGCVSFEGLLDVGSAVSRPLREPHDPVGVTNRD